MKKEDLTALGLTEEQITEIQRLNGLDVNREKDKLTEIIGERDNFKEQLDTTQKTLKKFEGVDIDKLQGEITKLTGDLEAKDLEYQSQIAERDFNSLLDSHISSVGARNAKAVKALLDVESLKASKNQENDIKTAIEACQKENDYLFGSTEPINNPVGFTGGGASPSGLDANTISLRTAMGLGEIKQ